MPCSPIRGWWRRVGGWAGRSVKAAVAAAQERALQALAEVPG